MKSKTHSGTKKRARITGSGKVMRQKTSKRHLLQNKSSKAKWKGKYGLGLARADSKRTRLALKQGL